MKVVSFLMFMMMFFVFAFNTAAVELVFEDIRPPDSSTTANFANSSIAWRPQGDYAILVSTRVFYPSSVGIHRYVLDEGQLDYQAYTFPDQNFQRAEFSADGTYALITGDQKIFRYEHNPDGFGTVTELTDIEDSASCTISFFDVLRHPVDGNEPMYIMANVNCGSTHQMKVYRYDPLASPQIYADVTGGVTPLVTGTGYEPITAAWQADGLYMVIGNYQPSSAHGGFFVWDPHHALFPPHHQTNVMQFFSVGGGASANVKTLCMSPVSTDPRFVMLAMGRVVRFTEYPTTMVADFPSAWHESMVVGDSGFNTSGSLCIFVEHANWLPHHRILLYDSVGDEIDLEFPVVGPNFTHHTGVRISSMKWHPFLNMGLMAGGNRWIFKFEYFPSPEEPTPTPTPVEPTNTPISTNTPIPTNTPTPVPTPEPPPIPAAGPMGLGLLIGLLTLLIHFSRRKTTD